MSWSVNASGKAPAVKIAIADQISKVNLTDAGEMETVKKVGAAIDQTLGTFDPDGLVRVEASGSMGFKDWGAKTGPFQSFTVKVETIHLTV